MKYATLPKTYQGIAINPKLPADFDNTPNDERPESHRKWWHVPFIRTATWDDMSETYEEYRKRLERWRAVNPEAEILDEDEFNAKMEEQRSSWFEVWPTGIRYEVRCLDGGAWDRSTGWGMVGTLEEAVEIAQTGPSWDKG